MKNVYRNTVGDERLNALLLLFIHKDIPLNYIREFKITTTATATGTSLNKRFNEQNNSRARAL